MGRARDRLLKFLEDHRNVGAYVFAAIVGLGIGTAGWFENTHRVEDNRARIADVTHVLDRLTALSEQQAARCHDVNAQWRQLSRAIATLNIDPARKAALLAATEPQDCPPPVPALPKDG